MTMYVWPRLPRRTALELYHDLRKASPSDLRKRCDVQHPDAAPVAVGGVPVGESRISALQRDMRELADRLGFPDELNRAAVARFDRPATRLLHDSMKIVPADAASADVWSFLSLVVIPDVAVWRFPDRSENRLTGHPRNVFRRLWWRAEVVGVDLIDVPAGLGEDELVSIMERPVLASNRRITRAIAAAVHGLEVPPGIARSEVMRDVAKRILRLMPIVALEVVDEDRMNALVDDALRSAIVALRNEVG